MPTCRVYVAKLKDLCLQILQKRPLESISSILYPTLITHEAEIREGASASISPPAAGGRGRVGGWVRPRSSSAAGVGFCQGLRRGGTRGLRADCHCMCEEVVAVLSLLNQEGESTGHSLTRRCSHWLASRGSGRRGREAPATRS
jgi:hypothetical protein